MADHSSDRHHSTSPHSSQGHSGSPHGRHHSSSAHGHAHGHNHHSASPHHSGHHRAASPQEVLAARFPGALERHSFLEATAAALSEFGFKSSNTVACVSVCRDEMCQPLNEALEEKWGSAFNMSSLAGMLHLGKTGMAAAMHHAPVDDGSERYFFMALPHIAVGHDGAVGECYRSGRPELSHACGALAAFLKELSSGTVDVRIDPLDTEYTIMKQELMRRVHYGTVPDLIGLTKMAADTARNDLEQLLRHTVDLRHAHYAVFIGIQIHVPTGHGEDEKTHWDTYTDYIWPLVFYAIVDGSKKDLLPAIRPH
eukprot:TRINITY_DN5266_c0_g1_i1.p1 TRINITY_DN5266_c0_g1~~TRINITY_DN5266_c0_g1_i1.p1  ORF type:complete len:311 (+),score=36.92 TRINITY_DN5266_c0_g1_i1:38-970(+)